NVEDLLRSQALLLPHTVLPHASNTFLSENVQLVRVCDIDSPASAAVSPTGSSDEVGTRTNGVKQQDVQVFVYRLNDGEEPITEPGDDDGGDNTISSTVMMLPSRGLEGLWETLIFEDDILVKLLNYVATSILFADRLVDPHIISFNKVILLHGPPGTGKTSLCRALAQKLSIRLAEKYANLKLVEINSHSLFSKFFSESGKLVMQMFSKIKDLCDDTETFVCVLIDEVESLTAARKAAVSGMEPSDAFRVVNALLTQLDALKRKRNVLILTTSNITEAIDIAFIDRADLKQYIGPPTRLAIYAMLCSTLQELMRTQLVSPACTLYDWRSIDLFLTKNGDSPSDKLYEIAGMCGGFSGRTVRKLPFLAHCFYLQGKGSVGVEGFLAALRRVVEDERK
ncbi:Pachytene checkpoint protein 2, partial [Irineochytrium annulatum]